jgi:hypothetical protein
VPLHRKYKVYLDHVGVAHVPGRATPAHHGRGSQGRASRESGSHSDRPMQTTRLLQFTCSPISLSAPLRRNTGSPPRSSQPTHRRATKNAAACIDRRTRSIVFRRLQAGRTFRPRLLRKHVPTNLLRSVQGMCKAEAKLRGTEKWQLCQEVRGIVQKLQAEGECPSISRLTALLPNTALKDWRLSALR